MSAEIILPKIDEAMTQGKIVEWKKKEGDWVEKEEVVFTVETEKVTWEVEAPEAGTLSQVKCRAGDEVPVGTIVAYVLKAGEKAPEVGAAPKVEKKEIPVPREPGETRVGEARVSFAPGGKVKASPLAKKLARLHGTNLSLVPGSGPGGRIVKRDILKLSEGRKEAPATPAAPIQEKPLSSMRETIARRMTESFQSVPHFYISVEADAEDISAVREKVKPAVAKIAGVKVTLTDLLVKIIAKALQEQPEINGQWTGKGIRQLEEINIGLAVGLREGLLVPVIRRANEKSLAELAGIRADFVERAQQGKIRMDEMRGGSMTLTNLGMYGIDQFDPIINPPESCILATGRILEKPAAYRGQVVVRKRMNLTLAIDHRVLDGVLGSRFLKRVKELIEQPILLM
jgi:pyruvate dehydrogenase E2 component (dihydrolipoamide acetyltransferase)